MREEDVRDVAGVGLLQGPYDDGLREVVLEGGEDGAVEAGLGRDAVESQFEEEGVLRCGDVRNNSREWAQRT